MKFTKTAKAALLLMAIALGTPAMQATDTDAPSDKPQREKRETMAATMGRNIAKDLDLNTEDTQRFVDLYVANQREIWSKVAPPAKSPRHRTHDRRRKHPVKLEMTDSAMQKRFERDQIMLDIRRKYYSEYAKFLTPAQIDRMYRLEHTQMNRLRNRHPKKR